MLTKEQIESMKKAAEPLMKWLNEEGHPHMTAIVTTTDCEIMEGLATHRTFEFVKD